MFANSLMHCGTTVDTFLRENLEWLKKATNWAKFSATAGQHLLNGCADVGLGFGGVFLVWRLKRATNWAKFSATAGGWLAGERGVLCGMHAACARQHRVALRTTALLRLAPHLPARQGLPCLTEQAWV